LDLTDGDALAQEVLNDGLLRAVWFDGSSIRRIHTATFFPFIVRQHETDMPVVPTHYFSEIDPTAAINYLKAKYAVTEFTGYDHCPFIRKFQEAEWMRWHSR
jgi:hypothetical protein